MRSRVLCLFVASALAASLADTAVGQTKHPTRSPAAKAAPLPPPPPPPDPANAMKTSDQLKRESVQGAASTPLRDLNVVKSKIPDVLLQAMDDPYARPPRSFKCPALAALVRPLDEALGPDIDRVPVGDENLMNRGKSTALGTAADLAAGAIIPFRGVVRQLSGAAAHDNLVQSAIISGNVRRAYLKGLGEAKGCPPPATPSHERAAVKQASASEPPAPSGVPKPKYPAR